MTLAERLRALAERVNHNLPRHRDPERFHVKKSEIAHAMQQLADEIEAPSFEPPAFLKVAVKLPPAAPRRVQVDYIRGPRGPVMVERRSARKLKDAA